MLVLFSQCSIIFYVPWSNIYLPILEDKRGKMKMFHKHVSFSIVISFGFPSQCYGERKHVRVVLSVWMGWCCVVFLCVSSSQPLVDLQWNFPLMMIPSQLLQMVCNFISKLELLPLFCKTWVRLDVFHNNDILGFILLTILSFPSPSWIILNNRRSKKSQLLQMVIKNVKKKSKHVKSLVFLEPNQPKFTVTCIQSYAIIVNI